MKKDKRLKHNVFHTRTYHSNEDFIRRDEIWFTDKNADSETELKRLTALGLSKRLSPYDTYKQGKTVPDACYNLDVGRVDNILQPTEVLRSIEL